MKKIILVVLIALASHAGAASMWSISATAYAGKGTGELRAQLSEEPVVVGLEDPVDVRDGRLRIWRVRDGALIQQFVLADWLPRKELRVSFSDLNDDGYPDLLIENNITGVADATHGSDVFLWIPARGRFEQSDALSQAGHIEKGRRGCVVVTSKCDAVSEESRTLCVDATTGDWTTVAEDRCRGAGH